MGPSTRIDALRRRIESDPASIAFAQLAEEYRRAGQLTEAVDTCRAGLREHPDYISARVTLGRALLALGRLDDAAGELQQVVDTAPDNLAATRALAEVFRRQGRMHDAATQFRAAAALSPGDPDLDRIIVDITHVPAAAPSTEPSSPPPSPPAPDSTTQATLAALEQWLEAIHAARADQ
jgi:tetratricopeptide (TPR) repeat protein